MKKVIKYKVYDTDTAREICYKEPIEYQNDLQYSCRTLYRKKTGEFFFHIFSNQSGNKIEPISFNDAKSFVEEYGTAEQYGELFGIPDEDSEDVVLGISVSANAAAKLKQTAAKNGITQKEQLERWILEAK